MTRYVLLAALGLAMAGGSASADCDQCDKFGWHPMLKIRNWFKKDRGDCGCKHKGHGPRAGGYGPYSPPPGIGYPGTPGADMPGTLVFPNHPFARSPRDFFMYEPK